MCLQGDAAFQGWQPVYRTEVIHNNLNPAWKPITVKATQLNNGDAYRPLLIRVGVGSGLGFQQVALQLHFSLVET
jgi:hypothetical protein